jgi:hypothetical protein
MVNPIAVVTITGFTDPVLAVWAKITPIMKPMIRTTSIAIFSPFLRPAVFSHMIDQDLNNPGGDQRDQRDRQ